MSAAISCAPLPNNPTILAALLQSIDRALDFVEPLRQQLNHEARILDQLDRGNLSDRTLKQVEQQFQLFSGSLRQRIAQGGPDHRLITTYLDLSDMPTPPLQLFAALRAIEHRRGTADEQPGDQRREQTLQRQRFDCGRNATEFFVQKVNELRQRVTDRLESSPDPVKDQVKTTTGRPKKRRRARQPVDRPLTGKELEAAQLVGEHKGNVTSAAKAVGISRQAMTKRYEKALKKLGKSALPNPRTQALPRDRRGQETL